MEMDLPRFLTLGPKKTRNGANPFRGLGAYRPWLCVWLIKLTLIMGWHRKPRTCTMPGILTDADFLELLGMEPLITDDDGVIVMHGVPVRRLSNAKIEQALLTRLEEIEGKNPAKPLPLFGNIERLGNVLGLADADKFIFLFAATCALFSEFEGTLSARNERVSNDQLAHVFHNLSGLPEHDFRLALSAQSNLVASGIVTVDPGIHDIESKLSLMDGLGGRLLQAYATDEELTEQFLKPVAQGTLTPDAYPHLQNDIALATDYLANVLNSGTPGCNLLFYGIPGTGKTELAGALARALKVDIYEVSFCDADGEAIRGEARLRAYTLCQRLLARRSNALLMFDEIEDVFPCAGGLLNVLLGDEAKGGASPGKAWINRTLESNAVPAIWITNNPSIDPAYLRRFDFSIRFPIPPQKVRFRIARHHLREFDPPEEWLQKISANEEVSPAQYERAAKVARMRRREAGAMHWLPSNRPWIAA